MPRKMSSWGRSQIARGKKQAKIARLMRQALTTIGNEKRQRFKGRLSIDILSDLRWEIEQYQNLK